MSDQFNVLQLEPQRDEDNGQTLLTQCSGLVAL